MKARLSILAKRPLPANSRTINSLSLTVAVCILNYFRISKMKKLDNFSDYPNLAEAASKVGGSLHPF